METHQKSFYAQTAAKVFLLSAAIAFMVMARALLIPIIVAFLFTFLLLPVSKKMEKWKFPRWIAILLSIVLAAAVFLGVAYFFWTQAINFSDDWPELEKKINEKIKLAQTGFFDFLNIKESERKAWMSNTFNENVNVSGILLKIFSATGDFLAALALIPVYIFFLTYYRSRIVRFIVMISGKGKKEETFDIIQKVTTVSQHYLKGILMDIAILAVLASTGYLLLGIKHAILFGLLVAVFNVIPYIGVLIGGALPFLMAILTKDEIGYALGAIGVSAVVQFLDNNFITPRVIGGSVSINPLAALIALVAGGLVWGISGMILSIPLMGILKVICDNVNSLEPYGYLIGDEVKK